MIVGQSEWNTLTYPLILLFSSSNIETATKKNHHRQCWLGFGVDEAYSLRSVGNQQKSRVKAVSIKCYKTFLNFMQWESSHGVSVKFE